MTATVNYFNGWAPIQPGTQLPSGNTVPLAASAQSGQGQAVYYDASGNVALNDGTVPGLIAAGCTYPAKLSSTSTTAGSAKTMVHMGLGEGAPASTIANDSFTAADVLAVAFEAGNGVPGKLSNYSGSNRSIMGLVFGLDDQDNPRVWSGPVASLLARGLLLANQTRLASTEIADAAASDTIAERTIDHAQLHGLVTSIVFNGAAIAADVTDYITVTVSKRDGAGGAAVVLGTLDTRAANQGAVTAFVDKSFALSVVAGALFLLETDIVTLTVAKGGAGKVLTGPVLVNGKVI